MGVGHSDPWVELHMWPQWMWAQKSSKGHLGSLTFLLKFFVKNGHCIHILWCIFMGLWNNDTWLESQIWPQQKWGQRSSRGHWPLFKVFFFFFNGHCIHTLWCISMGVGHSDPLVESHTCDLNRCGVKSHLEVNWGHWKNGHCIHILWCICMGLGHNDTQVKSRMWPQQKRGQRSPRDRWPFS